MRRRKGRKLVLVGTATFSGLLLSTVATAGGTTVADEHLGTTPTPVSALGQVGALAASDAVVIDLTGSKAAISVPTTSTTAPPAVVAPAAAPEPAPPPEPEPEPVAEPAAAPAPAPSGSAEEAIAAWFPDVYDEAVSVASCESSMDPGAVSSGGGNHGLFQINSIHRSSFEAVTGLPWSEVYNAYANAQFARHLYDSSGWGPWGCSP